MRTSRFCAVVMTATLAGVVHQSHATAIIDFSTPSASITQGTSFTLDVSISGVTDLYGWQFDLGFTPGVFAAGDATEGAFLANGGPTFFLAGTTDNVGGTVAGNADTLITAISGVSGDGTLAQFDLTALSPGVGTFAVTNLLLLDSSLNTIDAAVSDEAVAVTAPVALAVTEPASLPLALFAVAALALAWRRRAAAK